MNGLAGLELRAVPIGVALSRAPSLSAFFVRKKPKKYRTRLLAEGGDGSRRLLVIEDDVTSGGQVLASTVDLRDHGAIVRHPAGRAGLATLGSALTSSADRRDHHQGPARRRAGGHALSLARSMGPLCCHKLGTTSGALEPVGMILPVGSPGVKVAGFEVGL